MTMEWDRLRGLLFGADASKVNLAAALLDRQVLAGRGEHVAIRFVPARGAAIDLTYDGLAQASGRFATSLQRLGLAPGQTVAVLGRRSPSLAIATLGVLRAGAVLAPLHVSLGPDPLRVRLGIADPVIAIVDADVLVQAAPVLAGLPHLRHIIVIGGSDDLSGGARSFDPLVSEAIPVAEPVLRGAGEPALLHFTSGATGTPKGALQAQEAVIAHMASACSVFDLDQDDVFWCTAKPGWLIATAYALLAPLAVGATSIWDGAVFDGKRWLTLLRNHEVTVLYTTPSAIRCLMRLGTAYARTFRPLALRQAATVGEPLNAEAVAWARQALGVELSNTWSQTETGCIVIADLPGSPTKAGAMGRPVGGIEPVLVNRTLHGIETVESRAATGELALRTPWPSLFRGYVGQPALFEAAFADGWYLTGDLARRDEDGFYWFLGRSDDVIKNEGFSIGPFEVENVMMDHPAVSEVGVVGRPDPLSGEMVVAFVQTSPGFVQGEALRDELLSFGRERLGPVLAPKDVMFVDALPKTCTGKILRRVLKNLACGKGHTDRSVYDPAAQVG